MVQMQVLEARGNDIAAVPWSLYELTSLRKLDLSQNRLSRLHSSLGNLAQLNSLNLAYNQLAALPYEIGASIVTLVVWPFSAFFTADVTLLRSNRRAGRPEGIEPARESAELAPRVDRLTVQPGQAGHRAKQAVAAHDYLPPDPVGGRSPSGAGRSRVHLHRAACASGAGQALLGDAGLPLVSFEIEGLRSWRWCDLPQLRVRVRWCVCCAYLNGALMFALLFGTDGVGKTSLIQSLRSDSFKRESKLLGSKSGRNQRKGICIEDNTTTAAANFSPLLDSLTDSSIHLQFWEFSGTRSRSPLSLVVLRSFCPHLFSLYL
jgi:hypothetical protein